MKMQIKQALGVLAVSGLLAGMSTGCATYDRKVTVIDDQKADTTTVIRENKKEVKKTTYHKPVITEPEMVVAPDSSFKK